MDIAHTTNKGRMLDTLEKFFVYRETKRSNEFNDKLTVNPNVTFEALVHKDPHEEHTTSL
jgi:hypothetical protein